MFPVYDRQSTVVISSGFIVQQQPRSILVPLIKNDGAKRLRSPTVCTPKRSVQVKQRQEGL